MKQVFNKKIGAYVKYETGKDGKTKIVDVKESKPKTPFRGIPLKK